jgi:hypothetical protein
VTVLGLSSAFARVAHTDRKPADPRRAAVCTRGCIRARRGVHRGALRPDEVVARWL